MNQYLSPIIEKFEANRNPEYAVQMKRYMRNLFEFYGIKTPDRKEIQRAFFLGYGYPKIEDLKDITSDLWEMPERENQYFAMHLLKKYANKVPKEYINFYESLIVTKSWWDSVDFIAPGLVGALFVKHPSLIEPYTERWMESGNIWLQRSCILFQLKRRALTDTGLLFKFIEQMQGSKEFFINKAIGWALREYSKTSPETVINYVKNHELAPLSKREALKWINKHAS